MAPLSFVYSIEYIILLAFFMVVALCENRIGRNYARAISLTAFIFFFGGRGYIGWDWTSYSSMYETFPSIFDSSFLHDLMMSAENEEDTTEKGFLVYLAFFKGLGANYLFFVLLSVCIDAVLTDRFIERFCPNYGFAMLLFVYVYCNAEINLQRNIKSITIFLFSLQYAEDRKILPFLLLNTLGITFHFSAIFYVLAYFLFKIPTNRWVFLTVIVILNGIYLLQIDIIQGFIPIAAQLIGGKAEIAANIYTNSVITHEAGISIGALERLITSAMVFIFWDRLNENARRGKIFINSFLVYSVCIDIFWPFSIFIERISLLFMFCYIFIWSIVMQKIQVRKLRYICLGCIMLYSTVRFGLKYNSIFYKYDNFLLLKYEDESTRQSIFNRYQYQQQ